jgi:protein-tyrosine phosphatase
MPTNFKVVIPNKLYRSGQIPPSEIPMLVGTIWNVHKIVSLDLAAGTAIQKSIPEGVEQVMFPIEIGGNPNVQGRKLAETIKQGLLETKNGAVLVHCLEGRDRTGMAIAMFRTIKQGWTCTQAIEEAKVSGFGLGIADNIRKGFEIEICRTCRQQHQHYCQTINSKVNSTNSTTTDTNTASDDIVDESRIASNGIIPPATRPQQSFCPISDYTNSDPILGGVNIIASTKTRMKLLKKLIEKKEDENDVIVGQIDNYNGISGTQLNAPSSAPGAPNAAGPVDTATTIQI